MITKNELTDLLLDDFYKNFAQQTALNVVGNSATEQLYNLAIDNDLDFPKPQKDKIIFRAAYVLEIIFFKYNDLFSQYNSRFCIDFCKCKNGSAKRHFSKIMAHLLLVYSPTQKQCEDIAEKCAEWAVDTNTKIAVKILSIEVLFVLKNRVNWVTDILQDILEPLKTNPSAAIECRLKKWKDNY